MPTGGYFLVQNVIISCEFFKYNMLTMLQYVNKNRCCYANAPAPLIF